MDALQAIMTRRSYRGRYIAEPVSRADLRTIMEAGLNAPSGCNKQTTALIAVDDAELVRELLGMIDPPICETAPALICVLAQPVIAYRDRCYCVQDYSAAIENMLLAMNALGYASCWYEGHITDEDDIAGRLAARLGMPEGYGMVCLLPVGRPAERLPAAPRKRPFEERAWFNGFGAERK